MYKVDNAKAICEWLCLRQVPQWNLLPLLNLKVFLRSGKYKILFLKRRIWIKSTLEHFKLFNVFVVEVDTLNQKQYSFSFGSKIKWHLCWRFPTEKQNKLSLKRLFFNQIIRLDLEYLIFNSFFCLPLDWRQQSNN